MTWSSFEFCLFVTTYKRTNILTVFHGDEYRTDASYCIFRGLVFSPTQAQIVLSQHFQIHTDNYVLTGENDMKTATCGRGAF